MFLSQAGLCETQKDEECLPTLASEPGIEPSLPPVLKLVWCPFYQQVILCLFLSCPNGGGYLSVLHFSKDLVTLFLVFCLWERLSHAEQLLVSLHFIYWWAAFGINLNFKIFLLLVCANYCYLSTIWFLGAFIRLSWVCYKSFLHHGQLQLPGRHARANPSRPSLQWWQSRRQGQSVLRPDPGFPPTAPPCVLPAALVSLLWVPGPRPEGVDLLEASSVLLPLPLSTPCPCGENRNVLFTDLARIIKGSPRQLLSRKFWRNSRTKWSSSLQPRTAAQDHSSVCAGQKREQCLRPICVIRWHLSL